MPLGCGPVATAGRPSSPHATRRSVSGDGTLIRPSEEPDLAVRLGQVPKTLLDALITIEDRKFYTHWGIDPRGIARALFKTVSGQRAFPQRKAKQATDAECRTFPRRTFLDSLSDESRGACVKFGLLRPKSQHFQNALTAATTSQFHSARVEKRQLGLSQSIRSEATPR